MEVEQEQATHLPQLEELHAGEQASSVALCQPQCRRLECAVAVHSIAYSQIACKRLFRMRSRLGGLGCDLGGTLASTRG